MTRGWSDSPSRWAWRASLSAFPPTIVLFTSGFISNDPKALTMRQLEREIIRRAEAEIGRLSGAMKKSGRGIRSPEIEVWREEPSEYTSEFRLAILKNGAIDDFLEFHIFKNGKPVLTADQAAVWLRTELTEIFIS